MIFWLSSEPRKDEVPSKALQQINRVKDIGENLFFAISLPKKQNRWKREMSYFRKTETWQCLLKQFGELRIHHPITEDFIPFSFFIRYFLRCICIIVKLWSSRLSTKGSGGETGTKLTGDSRTWSIRYCPNKTPIFDLAWEILNLLVILLFAIFWFSVHIFRTQTLHLHFGLLRKNIKLRLLKTILANWLFVGSARDASSKKFSLSEKLNWWSWVELLNVFKRSRIPVLKKCLVTDEWS